MKVSIITTVYRAEQDLPRLLDSMMAQKSEELEFFLIDNASDDRCGEICAEYARRDPRFTVYTLKENIGYIRARNLGIEKCSGDYIGFCDSDDYLEPGGYDRAIEIIKKHDADLYITAYNTVTPNGTEKCLIPYDTGLYTGEQIKNDILPQAFGNVDGKLSLHGFAWKQILRRSVARDNGFTFMVELQPYEDQIFNIDIIKKCNKIYIDDSVIYNYIVNPQSITVKLLSNFDLATECRRIALFYREKKKRAENDIELQACSHQSLFFIYLIFVKMAKHRKKSTKVLAAQFADLSDTQVLDSVVENSNPGKEMLGFVKWCLRRKRYRLLIGTIRILSKFKRG